MHENLEVTQFPWGQIIALLVPHDHLLQINYEFQHSYAQSRPAPNRVS